jgi:hypothetical protein
MKAFRGSVVVALLLASVLVVVASPAFATPNLTASSGDDATRPHARAAVAPFITPSTNTRSPSVGTDPTTILTLGGTSVMCRTSRAFFYVTTTHTQARITSLSFGDARGRTCSTTGGGTVDGDVISSTATSNAPWHAHVRINDARLRSASGTVNVSSAVTFIVTIPLLVSSCQFTVPAQSVAATLTYRGPVTLIVDDRTVVTNVVAIRGTCPRSGLARFDATYTVTPGTPADAPLTVTSSS